MKKTIYVFMFLGLFLVNFVFAENYNCPNCPHKARIENVACGCQICNCKTLCNCNESESAKKYDSQEITCNCIPCKCLQMYGRCDCVAKN